MIDANFICSFCYFKKSWKKTDDTEFRGNFKSETWSFSLKNIDFKFDPNKPKLRQKSIWIRSYGQMTIIIDLWFKPFNGQRWFCDWPRREQTVRGGFVTDPVIMPVRDGFVTDPVLIPVRGGFVADPGGWTIRGGFVTDPGG